jgi:hypothetical protein
LCFRLCAAGIPTCFRLVDTGDARQAERRSCFTIIGQTKQSGTPDTHKALRMAMGTIQDAHCPHKGKGTLTSLIMRGAEEKSPVSNDRQLGKFSAKSYAGMFHSDHLIPAEFFAGKSPIVQFNDLDFSSALVSKFAISLEHTSPFIMISTIVSISTGLNSPAPTLTLICYRSCRSPRPIRG